MKRVVLQAKREHSLTLRHPWLFSGAVQAADAAASGETVAVVSAGGQTLGYGSFSPNSQIRVRMLSFDPCVVPDASFIHARVIAAVERRRGLLASGLTNAVRLINAESDGLPGVVADCYAGHVVCQLTSAGAEYWKATLVAALQSCVPGCTSVSERRDSKDRAKEGLATEPTFVLLAGDEPPDRIVISEGPCMFNVDVRNGHKTGYYLDQRAARAAVGALAKDADVLNCFSYTGGFGLYARAAGARHVTQVDISEDALRLARANEALCGPSATTVDYVVADVFQYLRDCRDAGRTFDLIVLDPPKFAATKSQVMKAARGYKDINLLAMKLLRPEGVLATFSCSGAMTQDLFDKVLAEAATDAHRDFQVIARTRQDCDHPVALTFPEGYYLKGVILKGMN